MALPIELLEFQNGNAYRSFPLRETTSKVSVDGLLSIPTNFMVDALCSVDSDITRRYYVSSLNISDTVVVVEISTASTVVGTFTVTPTSTLNQVYYLTPSSSFVGATGKLIVGTTSTLLSGPKGIYAFTLASAEFEARCFIPSLSGVTRILFTDAAGNTNSFTGSVVIQAGLNLRYNTVGEVTALLNAGDGLGLNKACDVVAPPITTINGIAPDEDGNFIFDADGCAVITAIQNGILLSSSCAKPCMGCAEISELIGRVIVVENNLISLRNTYQSLLSEYQALQQALSCSC